MLTFDFVFFISPVSNTELKNIEWNDNSVFSPYYHCNQMNLNIYPKSNRSSEQKSPRNKSFFFQKQNQKLLNYSLMMKNKKMLKKKLRL